MARKKKKFKEIKTDMTPMIDVTFLLLIFFIVTLKFKILEGRLDAALPKDRGTSTSEAEEIDKIDILIKVAEPGELVDEEGSNGLLLYQGREIKVQIGEQKFRYNPFAIANPEDPVPDLTEFLQKLLDSPEYSVDETPVSLDARKGVVYGDIVVLLDVVIREKFQKVSFAGTQEQD
ncbi:MAG: biopolymer transporter ExbD [Planctomycetota bacterium]|nr:biopolymer transporter ExbD [Planctomycetota bacterium]